MPDFVRRIVVTGVSRGLGRALLAGFVEGGHVVAGCARDRQQIQTLCGLYPAPQSFDVIDVSQAERVQAWAERVTSQMGPPDLLVNNAALINHNAPLWQVPIDEFSQLVDVNIKGMFHVIRAFLPAMIAARRGVIVNFSSGWGRATSPEVAPYCASKWAVEGLTQSLAQELPEELAAVSLNPGIIDTQMLRSCFGTGAGCYPKPDAWARKAVPLLLSLGRQHNGRPLSV